MSQLSDWKRAHMYCNTNVFRIRSESPLVTMYAIQLVGSTTMVPGIAILKYEYHTIGTFWYGTRVRTYVRTYYE